MNHIEGKDIINTDKAVEIAHQVLREMYDQLPEIMFGRDGGHLVIMKIGEVHHVHSAQVVLNEHPISKDQMEKFRNNAYERATRLKKLAEEHNHVSSWQSRNHEEGKYGGAIRVGKWIISFAGLPEMINECFGVVIAKRMDIITRADISEIASISGNKALRLAA